MSAKRKKPEHEPSPPEGLDEDAAGPEMPSVPDFESSPSLTMEGFVSITLNIPEGMYRGVTAHADKQGKNLELVVLEAIWAYLQKARG